MMAFTGSWLIDERVRDYGPFSTACDGRLSGGGCARSEPSTVHAGIGPASGMAMPDATRTHERTMYCTNLQQ